MFRANRLANKCRQNGKFYDIKKIALEEFIDCREVGIVAPFCWNETVQKSMSWPRDPARKTSFIICTYRPDVTARPSPVSLSKKKKYQWQRRLIFRTHADCEVVSNANHRDLLHISTTFVYYTARQFKTSFIGHHHAKHSVLIFVLQGDSCSTESCHSA